MDIQMKCHRFALYIFKLMLLNFYPEIPAGYRKLNVTKKVLLYKFQKKLSSTVSQKSNMLQVIVNTIQLSITYSVSLSKLQFVQLQLEMSCLFYNLTTDRKCLKKALQFYVGKQYIIVRTCKTLYRTFFKRYLRRCKKRPPQRVKIFLCLSKI